MREWPSIVPGAPEDYYIVVNHYGWFGTNCGSLAVILVVRSATLVPMRYGMRPVARDRQAAIDCGR